MTQSDLQKEIELLSIDKHELESQLEQALATNKEQDSLKISLIESIKQKYQSQISQLESNLAKIEDDHKEMIEQVVKQKEQELFFYSNGKQHMEIYILTHFYRERVTSD